VRRADRLFIGVLPVVSDLETSTLRRPRPELGCGAPERESVCQYIPAH